MFAYKSRIKLFRGRNAKSAHDVVILKFEAVDPVAALQYVVDTCEALCSTGRYGFYSNTVPGLSKLRVMSDKTKEALQKARERQAHGKGLPPEAKKAAQAK